MIETNMEDNNEERRAPRESYNKSADGDDRSYKRSMKFKKKICKFCNDKEIEKSLDYKRVDIIERFISNRGKIIPRRITGNCAFHQRVVAREIKKARSINLLPFKVM